jgi:hypothetical protein
MQTGMTMPPQRVTINAAAPQMRRHGCDWSDLAFRENHCAVSISHMPYNIL